MARGRDSEPIPESDVIEGAPHPRLAENFFGNPAAEQALLEAYRSGRLPQSWILGGPEGVGKATLAWRFARFVAAHPDWRAPDVAGAVDLRVDPGSTIFHRVASLGLGDLRVLRREWNARARPAKHFTEIRVEDVRAIASMFHLSASTGGWRICIVDCAEDLNKSSANALLKLIEEPPPKSLFLFISHRPGHVLPTIRSRSRLLMLQPLEQADIARVVGSLGAPWSEKRDEIDLASALARGSARRALQLLDGDRLAIERKLSSLLDSLPHVSWRAAHELCDKIAYASQTDEFAMAIGSVFDWLGERARLDAPAARLAPYAQVWETVSERVREAETYNLDKRALILSILADLAAAEAAARA